MGETFHNVRSRCVAVRKLPLVFRLKRTLYPTNWGCEPTLKLPANLNGCVSAQRPATCTSGHLCTYIESSSRARRGAGGDSASRCCGSRLCRSTVRVAGQRSRTVRRSFLVCLPLLGSLSALLALLSPYVCLCVSLSVLAAVFFPRLNTEADVSDDVEVPEMPPAAIDQATAASYEHAVASGVDELLDSSAGAAATAAAAAADVHDSVPPAGGSVDDVTPSLPSHPRRRPASGRDLLRGTRRWRQASKPQAPCQRLVLKFLPWMGDLKCGKILDDIQERIAELETDLILTTSDNLPLASTPRRIEAFKNSGQCLRVRRLSND